MGSDVVFFAWNRSIPGRENLSSQHFDDFVKYLEGLKKAGTITSWDVVFLNEHGGDMNGFFLLHGEPTSLDTLLGTEQWVTHMARATMHLENAGAVRGRSGGSVMEFMAIWRNTIPD